MAAFNEFNQTIADIANKVHNLGADSFKFMLTLTPPVATNSVKADLTEIAPGNGYTAGGELVTITSSTQTGGVYTWIGGSNPVITAAGGSIADFRYVVLYNDTTASDNLISFYDYGSTVTLADGESLTINASAVPLIAGNLS